MSSATASLASHFLGDPLLTREPLPLRQTFYPLGFPVEIETNNLAIHTAAAAHWPTQHAVEPVPALLVKIGVTESASQVRPPSPVVRAQQHLVTFIACPENFVVCDLQAGFAFGWITSAAMHHEDYFRHFFLEAVVMTLLCARHVMPFHAACVSFAGRSLLLSGQSGAGKSTLAYACARSGWTYTSDDACYLLWNRGTLDIRGNARQFRFRPAARELFPELKGYDVTPRIMGKPSIEVPTSEFPDVHISTEAHVHAMILLRRHTSPAVALIPMKPLETMHMLEESLLPVPYISALQVPTLKRLTPVPSFVLHYRDLAPAIERLRELAEDLAR